MNLTSAIRAYSAFQEARGDALTHRQEVARTLNVLNARLGDPLVTAVTINELREFISYVRTRPGLKGRKTVSTSTVFAYWRTVAAFFRFLELEGTITTNPMARVPKPKVDEVIIRPFSPEQVKRLLEQPNLATFTGLRDMILMLFLLDSGCRVSEALSLKLKDLDLKTRMATVLGKGKREREVPFGELTQLWLERYLEKRCQNLETDLVFVNQFGERISRNAMTQRIARYGRRAGLRGVRVSPHTFRHTFGVQWLLGDGEYKGDAISLQRILGHATPAMTQRYVQFTTLNLADLHRKLSPANRIADPPVVEIKRRRIG